MDPEWIHEIRFQNYCKRVFEAPITLSDPHRALTRLSVTFWEPLWNQNMNQGLKNIVLMYKKILHLRFCITLLVTSLVFHSCQMPSCTKIQICFLKRIFTKPKKWWILLRHPVYGDAAIAALS